MIKGQQPLIYITYGSTSRHQKIYLTTHLFDIICIFLTKPFRSITRFIKSNVSNVIKYQFIEIHLFSL